MPKVFIVQSSEYSAYNVMFANRGWTVVNSIKDADLVQFVGGADVNPQLYGHNTHPNTRYSSNVDASDAQYYELSKRHGKKMAGICRGGQFLNVCNGGKLVQDLDEHTIPHVLVDLDTSAVIEVSSTHHQMMIPADDGTIVAVANEATFKEVCEKGIVDIQGTHKDDIEVVYYANTQSLCFQPHPEFINHSPCCDYYFACLKRFLKLG